MGDLHINVGLFHGFQEGSLHSCSGDVRTDKILTGGNLVDLINIDNAILCQLYVIIRFVHQIADQVFHVTTNISCFAELGGITFDEGNPELIGNELHHVGLSHPCGANHDYVVFYPAHHGGILGFFVPKLVLYPVKVGTNLGSKYCLGLILLDDILVQVGFQFFGFHLELDIV